jgi:hypothetical protein
LYRAGGYKATKMITFMIKRPDGKLEPSEHFENNLDYVTTGEEVEVEVKKSRNIQFHRKYFAMLNVAFENQDKIEVFDVFRKTVLVIAGYFTMAEINGHKLPIADSISFSKCDELKFREIYSKSVDAILKYFCDIEDKAQEIMEFT